MLKANYIHINNINGFKNLFLNFNPGVNIISGPNGIGKTTILNCIYAIFCGSKVSLKLNAGSLNNYGDWDISYSDGINEEVLNCSIEKSLHGNEFRTRTNKSKQREVIYFNTYNRNLYNGLYGRSNIKRIKEWLFKNYFKSNISYEQLGNLKLIKECFYRLDKNIRYGRIIEMPVDIPNTYKNQFSYKMQVINKLELLVETGYEEIPFESLSSGYISCLTILLGIIKSIEMQNKRNYVTEFDGLIIIDEIELHLHPEWQSKMLDLLRWLVPNAQIIASTHSPHVIQGAEANEIIPLERDLDNNIRMRKVPASSEFGFQGWTIEEILTEVMGLNSPLSNKLKDILRVFEQARSDNDYEKLKESYDILSKMIHPENPLLKLLSIQAGELNVWEGLKYD